MKKAATDEEIFAGIRAQSEANIVKLRSSASKQPLECGAL